MSRRGKKARKKAVPSITPNPALRLVAAAPNEHGLPASYWEACALAEQNQIGKAFTLYTTLARSAQSHSRLRALIQSDLATLAAIDGRFDEARDGWRTALDIDKECLPARLNRDLVEAEISLSALPLEATELELVPAPGQARTGPAVQHHPGPIAYPRVLRSPNAVGDRPDRPSAAIRVALVSFLFNWPSTGGGNMHTAGLAQFLARAGFEVRHYYARYPAWGIGRVTDDGLVNSEGITFTEKEWNIAAIQARYRQAVDRFQPDYVVISDAWNMKPWIAEAMGGYTCFLQFQAQECLCPLNNLRLLGFGPAQVEQCPRNQLATPQVCHGCLSERGHRSGALHQHERTLAGVGTAEYDRILRLSLQDAEAVLVLNPVTAAVLEPHAKRVCVVPWGIDPARFSWPRPDRADAVETKSSNPSRRRRRDR